MSEHQQETIKIPEKLAFLLQPSRYKIAYGGRGGLKSWTFARAALILAAQNPLRIVCARELQKSIKESVHQLLENQIKTIGLNGFYDVLDTCIRGKNGSEIIFVGLRHNISSVKSLEDADIAWVEEAQTVGKASWDMLVPTVRKAGSEIWVSYNPDLEEDETHQRFVVHPPTNAIVVKIGFEDNPWLSPELEQERLDCLERDPVGYRNIWLGHCKQAVEGAVFANELDQAAEENRITRVPVKQGVPVMTSWDLGESDNTAIWFFQIVGMEYRIVDYYQGNRQKMPHYIGVLSKRGYEYGTHYLPHDAEHDVLSATSGNIRQQMQEAMRDNPALGKTVVVVPKIQHKHLAIEAVRGIFDRCVFDADKTKDGVSCLRRYRYATDTQTGKVSKDPVHDQWSHGSDAFMTMAQHARSLKPQKKQQVNTKWIV